MEFRNAFNEDLNGMMTIIKQAQDYFKKNNIDQWQNNYPNIKVVKNDIENKNAYVMTENDEVIAMAVISFDGEETYNVIQGKWLSQNKFAVIHRIAVLQDFKGIRLACTILKNAKIMCLNRNVHSIRIDTHKDNLSMQRLLSKNGFKYCGIIHLKDGNERMAFEKIF